MPYIFTFTKFPTKAVEKVAQRYLELLQKYPLPDYIKRIVPAATQATLKGHTSINVDEIKKEKLGDALEYNIQFMIGFRDIEGFEYEIKVFVTISEGLKYIGMG
jgi:hypothetical protein